MTSADHGATISPAAPPVAGLTVTASRPCFRCGYDLYGRPRDGVCPECGGPVSESLRPRYLRDAGPEYLRSARQAIRLAAFTVGFSLLGTALNGLEWSFERQLAGDRLRLTAAAASALLLVLVAWRISTVPRSGGGSADVWGLAWQRWGVRLAAAAVACLLLWNELARYRLADRLAATYESYYSSWLAFTISTVAVFLTMPIFGLWFARQLRRLPAPRLAYWTRLTTAGMTAAAAIESYRALFGFGVVAGWWPPDPTGAVDRVLVPIEGVLITVASAVAIVTMWHADRRVRMELRPAAEPPQ
jgi:hypothetical protein